MYSLTSYEWAGVFTDKTQEMHFLAVLELMLDSLYVEPYQCPSHQSIENWRSWKMRFFWGGHFKFSKSAILNFFFASSLWKVQPFYMRYNFVLHYGWCLQNLGKEAVWTNMHTTVAHHRTFLYNEFGCLANRILLCLQR